jgi:hypothetical protein
MAAKRTKKTPQFNTQFVRVSLTTEDKKAFAVWRKSAEKDVNELLNVILSDNHKVSFSFSEHNDSYICSITGKQDDCNNANKCFTSHGKDWGTALYVALYKYHVIFKGEAWEDLDDEEEFG